MRRRSLLPIECAGTGRSSGDVVDGRIDAGGRISFRLVARQGWAPDLVPGWFDASCRVEPGAETYEGSLVQGVLEARRVQMVDCPAGGRVMATASFRGRR